MTDKDKDQVKQKKTLEYDLRRRYRTGELTDQQIADLKEAGFPFEPPVCRIAKPVIRIDDCKEWPSCAAAEKELGITQGWMSDVCNAAVNGKWIAINNQFYCFKSMYSPDMDLIEIRGQANWIVNLETGDMFPTTTKAAKAAGTSKTVVLDHAKNKVKIQNKRFSYVRDWNRKIGRLVDTNVQMICLETNTTYHSYDEICADKYPDGYSKEVRKDVVKQVGEAIRGGRLAFGMHWANSENFEERKAALKKEQEAQIKPLIELSTMREYANVHEAVKFSSYDYWQRLVQICDSRGTDKHGRAGEHGERWFWKEDWKNNIELEPGVHIRDVQPVICYEHGFIYRTILEAARDNRISSNSLLNSGRKGKVIHGLTWKLLRFDLDFEKKLKETPLICEETGNVFDTFSDLVIWLEGDNEFFKFIVDEWAVKLSIWHGGPYRDLHFKYMIK